MNTKKLIFACISAGLIAISLILPLPAKAANSYYVSSSGNDSNPGTLAQPWLTIQKCLNTVKAGDTCIIMGGTYTESLTIKTSGASGAPITIKRNGSDIVTVNSGGSMTLQTSGHQSYYIFDGLRFISSTATGEESPTLNFWNGWGYDETTTGLGNTNITLKNCYIEGMVDFFGANNTVENCELNGRGVDATGIRAHFASSSGTIIKNNIIHDYTGRAVWINVIADNALIEGNTVYNTYLGIDCDGAGRPVTNCRVLHNIVYGTGGGSNHTSWGCSIFLEDAFNAVIDGNLLYGSSSAAGIYVINYGQGPSWYTDDGLEHRNQDLNAVIMNNVVYGNGDAQLLVESANGLLLYNNTFIGPSYTKATSGTSYLPSHFTIENNIFAGSGNAWNGVPGNSTWSNNLYYGISKPSVDSSVVADPKFIGGNNYRLQSGSPAINAGQTIAAVKTDFDGVSRLQGAGYDIGAFEYNGAVSTPVPGTTSTPTATLQPTTTPFASFTPTRTPATTATATLRPTNTPAVRYTPTRTRRFTPTATRTPRTPPRSTPGFYYYYYVPMLFRSAK
jgi:hypothetical protein